MSRADTSMGLGTHPPEHEISGGWILTLPQTWDASYWNVVLFSFIFGKMAGKINMDDQG